MFQRYLIEGSGPKEGKVHWSCLILLDSPPTLQGRESSKADLLEWLAQTCHRLSSCQAQDFPAQADCCSPGRSRRGQVQMEEDSLHCQESGGLGGGTARVRLPYHLQQKSLILILDIVTENHPTKFLKDVVNSVTVGFFEAFSNQISVVGKERPILLYHSL